MDNDSIADAIADESGVEVIEIEQEPGSVEFTSFTDFVDETVVEHLSKYWHRVERAHKKHGLSVTFNEAERTITVSTTSETTNPYIIQKARACIVLTAQFEFQVTAAYKGIDCKNYYDFIQTGYQDYGLAAIHGIDKEQYILRRNRLMKHVGEDCILVSARTFGHLKKFRSIVEKCILEGLDPKTLEGFGTYRIQRLMKVLKV